jgi:negative regulator of flagellin synthesis FlgM
MKIDEIYQSANLIESAKGKSTGAREAEPSGTQAQSATQKQDRGAEVELSSTSVEVRLAREAMEAQPPDRAEKVARLKEQVAEGAYEVDPKDIAEKMIQTSISDLT